jgi:hypothetical protein
MLPQAPTLDPRLLRLNVYCKLPFLAVVSASCHRCHQWQPTESLLGVGVCHEWFLNKVP